MIHSHLSRSIIICLVILLCILNACSKGSSGNGGGEPPAPTKDNIDIAPESKPIFSSGLNVQNNGTSQSVHFTASENWTATIPSASGLTKAATWISVSPTSGGAGSVNLTISVQQNTTSQTRTATIVIKCGTSTRSISVRQEPLIIAVTGITLNKSNLELVEGNSETLTATISPDNATEKTVSWNSSKTTVATVDNTGKVTAVSPGTAVITASCGGINATCNLTVTPKTIDVTGISLNKTHLEMETGASETLVATISPDNATVKTITWESSNKSVATVDNAGKVTALAPGNAVISASCGGKSATCSVKVSQKGNLDDRDGDDV